MVTEVSRIDFLDTQRIGQSVEEKESMMEKPNNPSAKHITDKERILLFIRACQILNVTDEDKEEAERASVNKENVEQPASVHATRAAE